MKERIYICTKYEDDTYYDVFYNPKLKRFEFISQIDPDYEIYDSNIEYDILAAWEIKDHIESHRLHYKKIKMERLAFCGALALLTATLLFNLAFNHKLQYMIRYKLNGDKNIDKMNLDYAKDIINRNKTINDDVKKYLLAFFNSIIASQTNIDIDINAMIRIINRISKYDYSNFNLRDEEKTVEMLAYIINSKNDVATKYLSREFYENFFNLQPSKKSLLFDAMNSGDNLSFCALIINGGDEYYLKYLKNKYKLNDEQLKQVHNFLYTMEQIDIEDKYDFEYYINRILAFNSSEFNALSKMDRYFSIEDLENGDCIYSGNIFNNEAVINIQKDSDYYFVYYDKEREIDITSIRYMQKFYKLLESFDGTINRDNSQDRLIVYIQTLASLVNNNELLNEKRNSNYVDRLYEILENYLGNSFYIYLSNENANPNEIIELIGKILSSHDGLNEEHLTFLAETILCLQCEVASDELDSYDYEEFYSFVSRIISNSFDEFVLFDFQKMINQGVNNISVGDLIKKNYTDNNGAILKITDN